MPRPTTRAGRASVALVLGAVLLLAGCAVGPSQRPPVATRVDGPVLPAPEPETAAPGPAPSLLPPWAPVPSAPVGFADCTAEIRATYGTALPAGRDLRFGCQSVPVGGRGGSSRAEVGVLQVTLGPVPPGGPVPVAVVGEAGGPTGAEHATRLAATAPEAVLAGTALYGVDLRGTGNSEPVDCITPTTREALVDADPLATEPAALDQLREAAATAARTCTQVLETALTDYRTEVHAEDLEEVRTTLGADRLHVVGIGDGGGVVASWARRYPSSVGRTVIDGAADPTTSFSQRGRERAAAAREALTAFAADCTARPDCPLGPDPAGALTGILTNLRAAPLVAPGGRTVTDGTAMRAVVTGLAEPRRWPELASAVAAAGEGDPEGVLGLLTRLEVDGGGFDAGVLLTCNDTLERPTLDQVALDAAQARAAEPLFGAYFAHDALVCGSWPVPTATPDPGPAVGPPPLVVATRGDPVTPLPGTERVATQLGSASLVAWLGAGHGAFPATPCVRDAVGAYLRDGALPPPGLVCPP
ncbi:alpha/beta hydrolase [Actinomycetospora cinnamomea]|uniref:TAP-like protein n=1 Tax=Actinomycetospora cinnamomea TaxID=663609 RepID=A0A2U1FPV9_9PSEU|nr:alpha/beta hydrolase [Actinomycetospora cinnamomea]PVZ14208.1 TAP-like protein [Actinomycetospora cinnamomea]